MALSLGVLLIPVVLIAWFFTSNPPDDAPVPTVDWQPVLAQARAKAPYPVLAPPATPAGWRATKASWTPIGRPDANGNAAVRNTWELGFLTGDTIFVALEQGDARLPDLISDATRDGTVDGTSTIAGATWERRISEDGRTRSLVQQSPKVATVVSGDTGYETLDAYVATLTSS
jgi:hypothetical protein